MQDSCMSTYSARLLIDYAVACGISRQHILRASDCTATLLMSDFRWMSYKSWISLLRITCDELGSNPYDVAYCATMHQRSGVNKQISVLSQLSINMLRQHINFIISRFVNKNLISMVSVNSHDIAVRFSPINVELFSADLCAYNRGVCSAIMHMRLGDSTVSFTNTDCVCNGDLCCMYVMPRVFSIVDDSSIVISENDINNMFAT